MKRIITIGREFGSGGRELGKRIAEELNIAYYDKEIMQEISKKTSLAEEYLNQIIEKKPITYYPITVGHTFGTYDNNIVRTQASIYAQQSNVIKELAAKSDCVIVGRCADYILKDQNPFRIFVYSNIDSKIKRCKEKGEVNDSLNDKKLSKVIKNIDKQRAKYYEFYTGQVWGDKNNYDICINTSNKTIKEIVAEIINVFQK